MIINAVSGMKTNYPAAVYFLSRIAPRKSFATVGQILFRPPGLEASAAGIRPRRQSLSRFNVLRTFRKPLLMMKRSLYLNFLLCYYYAADMSIPILDFLHNFAAICIFRSYLARLSLLTGFLQLHAAVLFQSLVDRSDRTVVVFGEHCDNDVGTPESLIYHTGLDALPC